jgi:hypothetical protein
MIRARVKPAWRNCGNSWGLEFPLLYGRITCLGWCAWDRHTGEVVFVSSADNPFIAEREAADFSRPANYSMSPFVLDAVP